MDVDIILEPDLSPGEMAEIGEVAEAYGIRALWASRMMSTSMVGVLLIYLSNDVRRKAACPD